MARTFWFVAGAGTGAYALTRARRVAESLTADGLRDRLSGLAVGARMFREEVAAGQAEKEAELRERLGLVPHGLPELGLEARSARTSTTEPGAPTSTTEPGAPAPTTDTEEPS